MRRATIALLAGALLVIPGAAVGAPSDGSVPDQEPSYPLVDSNGNHISDGLEAGIEEAAPSDTFDVIATYAIEVWPFSGSGDFTLYLSTGPMPFEPVVVVFDDTVADPAAVANEMSAEHGFAVGHVYQYALKGFAAALPAPAASAIGGDSRVVSVEPDVEFELDLQTLPIGVDRIEGDKNPTITTDGTGAMTVDLDVAILDSGIDLDHPDLNVGSEPVSFAGGSADDGNGHGSHVAGTVGALDNGIGVVGVAPGATVHAVRVCKPGGICLTSDMVAGIDWVAGRKAEATNGAGDGDPGIDFAVANMSISTSDDPNFCTGSSGAIHEAICGLVDEGVVFALAAGNNDREKDAYPEVLAVSALADFDGMAGALGSPTCRSDEDETLANFSNYGPTVDIAAPGVCIRSTWKDGGYNTISGTSMATPHVAGAVALYLHANSMTPATDAAGVDAIEAAIIAAALPQGHPCGYTNEHAGDGSVEPLLFVNGPAFKGSGACDPPSTPPGVVGSSVGFSGDDVVVAGDVSGLAGDLTYELWLKPADLSLRRNPLAKAYSGEGTITQELNGKLNFIHGPNGANTSGYQWFMTSSPLPLDTWTHVVLTRSGSTITWYLNGVQDSQKTSTVSPSDSPLPLLIGNGYVSGYNGNIDEVAVYGRAITPTEISDHYQSMQNGDHTAYGNLIASDNPISYWRLDETTGPLAADHMNNNTGTYQGTPTFGQPGANNT